MTTKRLITSEDPKGLDATAKWRGVYNNAGLTDGANGSAQRLNESREFWKELGVLIRKCSATDQYINNVVKSNYTYPGEFQRKPGRVQIQIFADELGLDPTSAFEYLEKISEMSRILPKECHSQDGNFAIISPFGFQQLIPGYKDAFDPELYCKSLLFLFDIIKKGRNFYNWREGQINKNHLVQTARTLDAYDTITTIQGKSPIWIISAQLGFLHKGECTGRARELFFGNEFGLGSVAGACIAKTHPERFVRFEELDMDLPGDEFSPDGDGGFSKSPCLGFDGARLEFGANAVSDALGGYGSASAFLPQL